MCKDGGPLLPLPGARGEPTARPRGLLTSSENHPPRQQERLGAPFISWVLRNMEATAEKQLWQVIGDQRRGSPGTGTGAGLPREGWNVHCGLAYLEPGERVT